MDLQITPNILKDKGLNQAAKPAYSVATVPVIRRKGRGESIWIIVLVAVLVIAVVALLHFGVIKPPVSAQNISTQSNINAFSTAQTPQEVMGVINSHISGNSAFSINYSGRVGLTAGITTINLPADIAFAKNGNLFRLSFDVNYSSFLSFLRSIINLSISNASSQNQTLLPSSLLVSGLLFYNGTGITFCSIKNASYANCSYDQMVVPQQDILYELLNSGSNNATEPIQPVNYSNLLSEINTSDYSVFTYKGVSTYDGQQCSLDDIGPVAAGNYSYTGSVCFSDSLGLPLYLQFKAIPNKPAPANSSLFTGMGLSVYFSSNVSSVSPSASYITSLPSGAVFYKK
ncbi:MAG: hypothetical protein OH316_01245 [Candidatus Parvarchaeota archaeon]|nr:hypothetical protein [Candidatus Parvarchaeota archaeon]MCW1301744.1 hypothetical protein [Candidatus Parvarchaeota archaeon]